jgi:hypothetical protein
MGRMRRGLVHTAAWMAATSGAVALSWFGVHTVLSGTAYDPPRALPVSAGDSARSTPSGGPSPSTSPTASSTQRPKPSKSPSESSTPKPTKSPSKPAYEPSEKNSGNVYSYAVEGGRVAFDQGPASATLVSATPKSGWEMKVWEQPTWIRVDFHKGNLTWSVFCVWNGHPPTVDTYREQR